MSNTPSLTPSEDLYWRLHGLSKILEGSGLIDESQHPDAYSTILDAMTFVRGQQPVVREPLTTLTIAPVRRFLADRGIYLSDETTKELIVVAHGITQKGGSNAE